MNEQICVECGIIGGTRGRVRSTLHHTHTSKKGLVSMTMSSDLTTFQFDGQSPLHAALGDNGEPMMFASDVCAILGLANVSQTVSRLDDDEKGITTIYTPGGEQQVLTVNEAGFYKLVFTSRKPEAKRFQKWVTSEVLPALRKTGSYTIKPMSPAQQLLMAAQQLVDHEERLQQVEEQIEQLHTAQLALSGGENYYTVKGFYHVKKLGAIDHRAAAMIGRRAARLSRDRGVSIGKATDPLYGEINTYSETILTELIGGIL